jgi:PPP family 3-phenylpropionic acid transporter
MHQASTKDRQPKPKPTPLPWKGLLLFRTLYFLDGLGGSAWGRFGVIFYNQVKHLSSEKIGLLQGIRPIIGFIARPLWGWLADRIQSRKTVFLICKFGTTACLLTLALPSQSFSAVAASVAGMAVFPTGSVLDAHTIDFLGQDHSGMYGSIRLFAAISWGLGSVVMGLLTDRYGFVWNFAVFGTMMFTTILFTSVFLPARSKSEQALRDTAERPKWITLQRALCHWQVLLWLLEVTIMGAAMAIVNSFLFVFLQNDLDASTALCGYTVGVTVLLEIPVFRHSKILLARLGHDGLFVIAMLAYATRVIGYTLLTPDTVHWILVLEMLHGITFACAWTAAVDFSAQVAPKEWSTLVQSLMAAFWSCVGGGLGPILGGIVYQRYGAALMFRYAGGIVLVAAALHAGLWGTGCFGHGEFLRRSAYQNVATDDDDDDDDICEGQHVCYGSIVKDHDDLPAFPAEEEETLPKV